MYIEQAGIYRILNTTNGDFYVGSAVNLRKRRNRHFSSLDIGNHYNIHLQRAFNLYGKNSFIFEIILICDTVNLALYEQAVIDCLHPKYNIRVDATSNLGVKRSEEYKKNVGDFFRGKRLSLNHVLRRSKSMMLNGLERSSMTGIQLLPGGAYRVKVRNTHLGCFQTLEEAQNFRVDYIHNLFGGG